MSDELMLVLIVCLNGPHELINEDLEDINGSFDVFQEIVDVDSCNKFG